MNSTNPNFRKFYTNSPECLPFFTIHHFENAFLQIEYESLRLLTAFVLWKTESPYQHGAGSRSHGKSRFQEPLRRGPVEELLHRKDPIPAALPKPLWVSNLWQSNEKNHPAKEAPVSQERLGSECKEKHRRTSLEVRALPGCKSNSQLGTVLNRKCLLRGPCCPKGWPDLATPKSQSLPSA